MKKKISIYVHIPFCMKKCKYCDFLSSDKETYGTKLRYMDALCQEIKLYAPISDKYIVNTIFFGGGTPSLMDEAFISNVLNQIRSTFEVDRFCEITLEANPGTVKYNQLLAYRSIGINRLSIGLQSTNDELLRMLGRIHNFDQFVAAFNSARRAGFKNINVDIMSGLPGQDIHSFVDTLNRVIEFGAEHISAYSLIVEEGTPLSCNEELLKMLPSETVDRHMYAITKKVLSSHGYERYEFSNYSKPGYECRHNLTYWTGGEYIGFGVGAASFFKGERFSNIRDIDSYVDLFENIQNELVVSLDKLTLYDEITSHLRENVEQMYVDRRMEEFMFLGLRMIKGVSRREFYNLFKKEMFDVYGPVINKYEALGYLLLEGDRVRLSDAGIDVSNQILADFLL